MSTGTLYNRIARVTLYQQGGPGGLVIQYPSDVDSSHGLRIQATVKRTLKSQPNTLDLTITNLSKESRDAFSKPNSVVQVDAGHDGVARLLFFGDVRFAQSVYSKTDWTTHVLAGDGARAYARARVNRSYRAGTDVATVLKDCAASLGLQVPKDVALDPDLRAQFASGLSLEGYARDQLTELLAPYGYRWSIQGGKLQVLRDDQVREDLGFVISDNDTDGRNGMIGVPELSTPQETSTKQRTVTAKVLLYPEIAPGATVKVVSRNVHTLTRADQVTHALDTHGADWTTTVEGVFK
jgi:hypothetical protein